MWKATPVTVDPPLENVCLHTWIEKEEEIFIKSMITEDIYVSQKEERVKKTGEKNTHIYFNMEKEKKKNTRTCTQERIKKRKSYILTYIIVHNVVW